MKLSQLNARLLAIEEQVDALLPATTAAAASTPAPEITQTAETTETSATTDPELPADVVATLDRLDFKLADHDEGDDEEEESTGHS